MNTGTKIMLAASGGYVLGRTKKMKLALALGLFLAGRKLPKSPLEMIQQGAGALAKNEQVSELTQQVRGSLLEAGKAAAGRSAERWLAGVSDRLREGIPDTGAGAEQGDEQADQQDGQQTDQQDDQQTEQQDDQDQQSSQDGQSQDAQSGDADQASEQGTDEDSDEAKSESDDTDQADDQDGGQDSGQDSGQESSQDSGDGSSGQRPARAPRPRKSSSRPRSAKGA